MARFGKRAANDDAAEQVADAVDALSAPQRTDDSPPESEVETAIHAAAAEVDTAVQSAVPSLPIPPLLTDEPGASADAEPSETHGDEVLIAETCGSMGVAPDPAPVPDPVLPELQGETDGAAAGASEPTPAGVRDRAAEQASIVRERAAEHAGVARERAAEHAAAAREKLSGSAGEAKERLADGAAEAKVRGAKMRKRFADAAADARDSASSAAAEARDRVASADVNEFAHSTTRLIDTARPFFLAGFAVVFAVLGFLEGDSGTAQLFVAGSIVFVIGAGFSSEINAFVHERLHRRDGRRDSTDEGGPGAPTNPR